VAAFWADEETRLLDPARPHVVRDSKTPSGAVPISALRGPVISDALTRTFRAHGLDVRFVYTIDAYDPMDSQSLRQKAGLAAHLGHLRELRTHRHDAGYRLRRKYSRLCVSAGLRRVGARLRARRPDIAVQRKLQAPLERAVVRAVGPFRRHVRGGRQGSFD